MIRIFYNHKLSYINWCLSRWFDCLLWLLWTCPKSLHILTEHFAHIFIANTRTDPLPLINVFLIVSTALDASFASLISIAAVTVDPDDICSVTFLIFMPTNLLANVMPVILSSVLMSAHLIDPMWRCRTIAHNTPSLNHWPFCHSACNNRSFVTSDLVLFWMIWTRFVWSSFEILFVWNVKNFNIWVFL